jgi:diguanylate cyclase (GGDEF)-like protein/putative nucleotidyltransferase with HDIG domain
MQVMRRLLERLEAARLGDTAGRRMAAGRVGGLLWLLAALLTPALALLPQVRVDSIPLMIGSSLAAVAWGAAALAVLDWRRLPDWIVTVTTLCAVAYTALTVAATGGTSSPARTYIFLILVYAAAFLRRRDAALLIGACALEHALPVALAGDARAALGELAFTAPVFYIVAGTVLGGRELLARRAFTDPLTGLANHRAFQERLHVEVARAQRHGRPLALAVLDVDRFKSINDVAGHATGDRVLARLAGRLRAGLRAEDVIARTGGDEFAVLLPETDAPEAFEVLERARQDLERTPLFEGMHVTVSAGICGLERAADGDALTRLADGALYWSKEHGRNTTWVYDPGTVRELSAAERLERLGRSHALAGIRALARAIDAKDPSTREHSERVAALAARLAHAAGWRAERVALLHEAALVHDVGKIGVPDAVLLKPGRLDPDEYAQVKEHAALGARIVEDVLSPEQVSWIRSHHERPDGRGYPDGLSGHQIPAGAALLAAADCFDVMTVARPYSRAKDPGSALAECRGLIGRQFSADAVTALERAVGPARLERAA